MLLSGLFLTVPMTRLKRASLKDISSIAPLFDAYRVFYKQPSDLSAAIEFLEERLSKNQSVIFLAFKASVPVGFTQLYTTFSSVSMQPVLILNDLFVDHKFRNMGIGEALLGKAIDFCKEMDYKGLSLETALDNPARHLYEKLGWKKDTDCFHYFYHCE